MKKGQQEKMDFRGGSRPGAGRKSIGDTKRLSITLPPGEWDKIDKLIQLGHAKNYADYFRNMHLFFKYD